MAEAVFYRNWLEIIVRVAGFASRRQAATYASRCTLLWQRGELTLFHENWALIAIDDAALEVYHLLEDPARPGYAITGPKADIRVAHFGEHSELQGKIVSTAYAALFRPRESSRAASCTSNPHARIVGGER
jgi:hypothetical protein